MTVVAPADAPRATAAGGEPLRLADGVELLGEFEGSGFKEPPRLARRADGQMIQLSRLFHLVAAACDGHRDEAAVAAVVTEQYGRGVSARNVRYVVERKLRPLGVLALADGTTPKLRKRAPVMALRCRKPILGARAVNALARCFTSLHRPPVQIVLLGALAALDVWLFGVHGIAAGLRAVLYQPVLLLGLFASIVVATAFHEIGHASACRYGGARPGVMGVGIYLIWPAFYCDVTEAYRLGRWGRLRTDLGGVYFNGLFALMAGAAYFATGQEGFLLVAFVQHTIVLQQLLPLLRFDGYYVLSDLTGVPDILSRIKPIFRSLVPGTEREPRVHELKPWVRSVVTVYLVLLVPTLTFMIVSSVLAAPRMAATAYDSMGLQLDRLSAARGWPEAALDVLQILALVMPLGAIVVGVGRSGRMAARGLFAWSAGSVRRRLVALAIVASVVAGAGYTWWPNGDYQPLRPGERGTIGDALATIPAAPGGRPSFTPARAARYGGEPTMRETGAPSGRGTAARPAHPAGPDPRMPRGIPAAPSPVAGNAPGGDLPVGEAGSSPALEASPAATPTATPTPTTTAPAATATPTPSSTATAAPTATPTPTSTPTPAATATATPTPEATSTPAPAASASGTATPSATPVATP